MTDRELLLYIYGYLNGILNMNKIPSHKISKLNEIILLQQERNNAKLQVTNAADKFEKEDSNKWDEKYRRDFFKEDNQIDNDKYYNENLDLDQQDPDFYC